MLVAPADGRLRGVDFALTVTGVGWPAQAGESPNIVSPAAGSRLVAFSIRLTEPSIDVENDALGSASNTVSVGLSIGDSTRAVDLTGIDNQMGGKSFERSEVTGTASYVAAVPIGTKDVNLVASEDSFSQSFSLWSLRRVTLSPIALYRDPSSSTVTVSDASSAMSRLVASGSGDENDDVTTLDTATLSYFSPDGTETPASSPSEAFLSISLESDTPSSGAGSTLPLSNLSPLPGDRLRLEVPGHPPVTATMSNPADPTGGNSGLLDATYAFAVPADLTTATLVVEPGADQGQDVGLGTATINLQQPLRFAISFPASIPDTTQEAPPWTRSGYVPPTGVAPGTARSGRSSGFPNALAGILLGLIVGGLLLFDHRTALRERFQRGEPSSEKAAEPADDHLADGPAPTVKPTHDGPHVAVLGPIRVTGWRGKPERRVAEELLVYLALHPDRPRSAEEIGAAVFSLESGREEVTAKTLRSYLSGLRQAIGQEHLPDAAATSGYLLVDVATDWADFRELAAAADRAPGTGADELRQRALSLVRGAPFIGIASDRYGWVYSEPLASDMTAAIVDCAHRFAEARLGTDDLSGAEEAARAGLRGAPGELTLLGDLVAAVRRRNDPSAGARLTRELRRVIGDEATERLLRAPGTAPHRGLLSR